MIRKDLLERLDRFIQDAKIYLNENELPEARDALDKIIKIAEKVETHDQAPDQDGYHSDREDQGAK